MPNHVTNKLIFEGNQEEIKKAIKFICKQKEVHVYGIIKNDYQIEFLTAWNPPIDVINDCASVYKNLIIKHKWLEEGNYNCGECEYNKGNESSYYISNDDYENDLINGTTKDIEFYNKISRELHSSYEDCCESQFHFKTMKINIPEGIHLEDDNQFSL